MDDLLKGQGSAVFIFFYLLPGFLGTVVYDFLVEGEKRELFDRVLFALSLTLLSALLVHLLLGVPLMPAPWLTKDTGAAEVIGRTIGVPLAWSTLAAGLFAAVLAFLNNHGWLLAACRWARITDRSSNADVWQDAFKAFPGCWVRLTFQDGRELVGWPRFYSSAGKPREIFLANATWWVAADGAVSTVDVEGPGVYIGDMAGVRAVALLGKAEAGR